MNELLDTAAVEVMTIFYSKIYTLIKVIVKGEGFISFNDIKSLPHSFELFKICQGI